jgi:hypothetical protein
LASPLDLLPMVRARAPFILGAGALARFNWIGFLRVATGTSRILPVVRGGGSLPDRGDASTSLLRA